jgi:hypothetical protein
VRARTAHRTSQQQHATEADDSSEHGICGPDAVGKGVAIEQPEQTNDDKSDEDGSKSSGNEAEDENADNPLDRASGLVDDPVDHAPDSPRRLACPVLCRGIALRLLIK